MTYDDAAKALGPELTEAVDAPPAKPLTPEQLLLLARVFEAAEPETHSAVA